MSGSTHFMSIIAAVALVLTVEPVQAKDKTREALWEAVRSGDTKAVEAALDKGADINARNEIGITALWIATSKGKLDVIELLVKRGADVNSRDGIWYQTPLSQAASGMNADLVKFLIKSGAKDIDDALLGAAGAGRIGIARAVLNSGKVQQEALDAALTAARSEEMREALRKAGAKPLKPPTTEERTAWAPLAGTFESENGGSLTVELSDNGLATRRGGSLNILKPTGTDTFQPAGAGHTTYSFELKDGKAWRVVVKRFTAELSFYNVAFKPVPKPAAVVRDDSGAVVAAPTNWPQFRGVDATGVADGQNPPLTWDVKTGANVRWKTPIPGLGHSCPVVWGDRVFLTTAVSSGDPDPKLRIGNYGDVASVNDRSKHSFQVFCLDRASGKVAWSRTAFEGVPKIKRHLKGSHANCTPATDGKRVVFCFGSEGMYCYDFAGNLVWKRDLGTLDASFKIEREYEWGFGSSPVIHEGNVILQCDVGSDSFIAAYRLEDGSRAWSTPRDEIPSWSSPTVWKHSKGVEIVTNAAQFARGYDPATGKELWRLAKKSEVTIPAPVPAGDLIYITSGNRPIQPIIAVRPGAAGDISLKEGESRNEFIAWGRLRGGPYMPTPIVYGKYLYVCGNGGMVSCYEADSGKEVYKERLGGVSYTASPVAADGRIYFTSEQGQVRVLKPGPKFELLAVNDMADVCMATPAISGGALFVRTQHFLCALGRTSPPK